MACYNINDLKYLITYDSSNPKIVTIESSSGVFSRSENIDYYYIQFSDHNSFKIFDIETIIPYKILKKIKKGKAFLVLDNGLEPFLKSADGIYYNLVLTGKIPARQIIFMSSVPTMIDHVKKLAKTLKQDEINVEWFSMFEYQLWDVISHQLTKPLDTLEIKNYNKKFINFNRRWRLHRPLMMILLKDKNLLDQGFVSFGQSDFNNDTWEHKWNELVRYYNGTEILEILNRNQDIKLFPPMYLDTEDLITNRAEQTNSTDRYYLDSYFSLVNETTYHTKPGYDGVPFLSEKIFKCIAMKHPFIMVTAPKSLKYLQEMGYQTFNGLIDESYDTIIDDGQRAIAILNEVDRLCKLQGDDLINFLVEARRICDYNYNIMKNKTVFIKNTNGI
jgi:hypothetical protein